MTRSAITVCLVLVFAAAGFAGTGKAARMQAPGSRVVLDLPAGWRVASRFTGFEHARGGSIVILELPGDARDRLTRAIAPEPLKSKGIVDVGPLALARSDVHTALAGRQPTRYGWFQKLMLLIGDDVTTALVTANLPQSAIDDAAIDRAAVVTALASARLAGVPSQRGDTAPAPPR